MKKRRCFRAITLLLGLFLVTSSEAADPESLQSLVKITDILQKEVRTPQGESLGWIEDVVVDGVTSDVAYAVLAAGGLLGLGEKVFAIPWPALQWSVPVTNLTLNVDKERLLNAPGFDKDQWPDMANSKWGADLHTYYQQTPYWTRNSQSARASSTALSQRLHRITKIIGSEVHTSQCETLGKIEDVVITADTGEVAYAVLSVGGLFGLGETYFAIPWPALQPLSDAETFTLPIDRERLWNAPGFNKEDWPDMANREWAAAVHAYYQQPPYWERGQTTSVKTELDKREVGITVDQVRGKQMVISGPIDISCEADSLSMTVVDGRVRVSCQGMAALSR